MFVSNFIGIIADDLTGANDTALQFHLKGCNTQILLDIEYKEAKTSYTQAWAIAVDSRNLDPNLAFKKTTIATKNLKNNFNVEYFYKKIDSTLRGNIAQEVMAMLEVLNADAAVIVPAFPNEGRITIGGYHLLKGVPIERTELARDPYSPIYESYIPTILKTQLSPEQESLIGLVDFQTVLKGAGPILMKLKELISNGKKLIVIDSASIVDLEQIALAIGKINHKILPCGAAGLAQALCNIWLPDMKNHHINKKIPKLPKLIISGSSTDLTFTQIKKLEDEFDNVYSIALTVDDILNFSNQEYLESIKSRIKEHLSYGKNVIVHTSSIKCSADQMNLINLDYELSKEKFSNIISDYLATLTKQIVSNLDLILILIGGETSFKCCEAINSQELQVVDQVTPTIPLCIDHKAQWIVTKSGNLGNSNTLIEILRYFEKHE